MEKGGVTGLNDSSQSQTTIVTWMSNKCTHFDPLIESHVVIAPGSDQALSQTGQKSSADAWRVVKATSGMIINAWKCNIRDKWSSQPLTTHSTQYNDNRMLRFWFYNYTVRPYMICANHVKYVKMTSHTLFCQVCNWSNSRPGCLEGGYQRCIIWILTPT